jgi:vitamin B12 transporter
MNRYLFSLGALWTVCGAYAQSSDATAELAPIAVYSERVANQEVVGTFAMPVSGLSYEPQVDVQSRNLSEGQADVSIRGGIFENTGFRIGAVALYDPQTGHYLAEIPVAPSMLQPPAILVGMDNALLGFNANAGTVAYGWRPIRTAGSATVAFGEDETNRQEFYQGYSQRLGSSGLRLGADVALARSESDGTVAYGDHDFDRGNVRLQLSGEGHQTDLFAGYQSKFFSWPNLYTPFGVIETEDLQTLLVALNHRRTWADHGWLEVGAFWRRNRDEYVYDRFAPKGLYQHTSWARGVSLAGRNAFEQFALNYDAQFASDSLKSTTLTKGHFNSRTYTKLGLVPETSWTLGDRQRVTVKAGATFDDTNRDDSAVSPVAEVVHEQTLGNGTARRLALSYTETTQVATYTALNSSMTAGLFRGNPDLGRATSHNLELSIAQPLAGWKLKAAVFYRYDDDLVDWTFRNGVTARLANPVDIDNTGVELSATRTWSRVDVIFGYTGLTKDADYGLVTTDGSFYALNYPKHRLTAALVARLGAGFEFRMDNEARLQADNPLRKAHGDSAMLSTVSLGYRPSFLPRCVLTMHVSNLWDEEFEEVPAVPASRRQYVMSASYSW